MSDENEQRESDYIKAIWFVSGKDKDWMATVFRHEGETVWRFRYRFRYHDKKVHDPWLFADRKSSYAGKDTYGFGVEHVCQAMDDLAALTKAEWKADICERLDVEGTADRMMEPRLRRPWMHFKRVEKE